VIERSPENDCWCVYSRHTQMLVPWWGIPFALLLTAAVCARQWRDDSRTVPPPHPTPQKKAAAGFEGTSP
jgi:hypothetical protein